MTFLVGEKEKYGWHLYSTCWNSKLSITQVKTKKEAMKKAVEILENLGFSKKNPDFNNSNKFRFSYF